MARIPRICTTQDCGRVLSQGAAGNRCRLCYESQSEKRAVALAPMSPLVRPIDTARLKARVVETAERVEQLRPLMLFRGGQSLGRYQALWNFILTAKDSNAQTMSDIFKLSILAKESAHLGGLHSALQNSSQQGVFSRLWSTPEVMALEPGLDDFIATVVRNSRGWLYDLEKIPPTSVWSKQAWRRPGRVAKKPVEPLPQFWPFLAEQPTDEHDLVMVIDGLVPKTLPEMVRQDVCQDLIVSVLGGEVSLGNLQDALPKHVRQAFKLYPSKYGPISLDAPPPWDPSGRPLLEKFVSLEPPQ